MDSHFNFSVEDQDKLIQYLKDSYSDNELFSLLRLLDINKNDVYSKYYTRLDFCESIVDAVMQKGVIERLFNLFQTQRFFRDRLINEFAHLGINKPIVEETFIELSKKVHSSNALNLKQAAEYNEWIQHCKEKMVLVLGKDSPEESMKKLENICGLFAQHGYIPILIKKEKEIPTLTNEEKMLAYASLARFVVIEKSEPAGQIDEAKICAFNRFPAIWLRKEGCGDTWMQGDYEVDFKNIKTFEYNNENVGEVIHNSIVWVEQFIGERTDQLNKLYPWRNQISS